MAQEEEKEVEEQDEGKEEVEEQEAAEEAEEQQPMELPPVTFENYIFGLYNTALFHLGVHNPETGELIQNLPVARHTIDTLGMIQEKTKGNLTAPESNLMDNLLYELRMNYLRAAKQAEEEPTEEPEAEPEEEPEKEEEKADDEQ